MKRPRITLATLAPAALLLGAAGWLKGAPPDLDGQFPDQPPTALVRQLESAVMPAAPTGFAMEQRLRRVDGQGAVVIRSTARNTSPQPNPIGEAIVADWTFRVAGARDSGYAKLKHRDDVWYESTYWQGDERWLRVGKDWHHPGDRAPSVRRFTAPKEGKVSITGRVYKAHRDGDGVRVSVLHNDETVWQHELAGDDGQGVDPALSLDVRAGDAIRFVVHKKDAIYCDTTHWDPVIEYEDGPALKASEGFSKKQGEHGWSYEMPVDGAAPPGLAELVWFDRDWAVRTDAPAAGKPITLDSDRAQPCVVLADGEDQSGVAIAVESGGPWRLQVAATAEGKLNVRVTVSPSAGPLAPGQAVELPEVVLGAYQGSSGAGIQTLARWLGSTDDALPVAELRGRLASAGIPELDLWAMIQNDWRQQDATDPARPETYAAAIARHTEKTRTLLEHLRAAHGQEFLKAEAGELARIVEVAGSGAADPLPLYLKLRLLKRRIALANPLLDFGELLFCKRVPTSYSHLVMQYYGWRARPGGGLFVLEEPGRSLRCRDILGGRLEAGNVLEPRLSYDGRRVVFSYVECPDGPLKPGNVSNADAPERNFYHIWEVNVDGTGLRQLSDGPYDDMMPTYLPDGGIAFMSTRRMGYARCFGGQFSTRWDVYTLHRMEGDGSKLRTLSYHDTNEWFPAVSNTGHILYARWDYIDRDAVTHQNLWASRPDGTNPIALWGNATPKPHCTFQIQPIPGSQKIIFTASAHHSIAGGSLTIVDPTVSADGPAALERITPEIPFPEAEGRDIREYYTAPWPLSEDFFLVGYSPYPLVWEPGANRKDALGIYLLDRFGNRELIYRDPEIGSTNPCPLRLRPVPPVLASALSGDAPPTGEMVLGDVYEGLGDAARGSITRLRIVQLFPKTTNLANRPPIGLAGEENGRAVLGTVPVEPDGSARFLVHAGKLVLFQALDQDGLAYQTMRSGTYLQPGERVSCVGCHEHKMTAPLRKDADLMALSRPPSPIEPGRFGGRPFSYVEVVQPVLDEHCVRCHGGEKTEGDIVLTGEPAGGFNRSYVTLMEDGRAFWGGGTNPANAAKFLVPRFGARNQVQVTPPGGMYGARGSRLVKLLRAGHEDVQLSDEDLRRLALWIDLNAIFYGVYPPEDQARMLRGEAVEMPDVQ